MTDTDPVLGSELGPEFDQGVIQANTVRLKLGSGLSIAPDGTINSSTGTLSVTTSPLYEYHDLWAEESAALTANSTEYSYGNGGTGNTGVPMSAGWELIELGFNADVYSAGTSIEIECIIITPAGGIGATLGSISLADETDGGGTTNNAYKLEQITGSTPLADTSVVTFRTGAFSGAASDAKVVARFRRQIGDYVTGVTIT